MSKEATREALVQRIAELESEVTLLQKSAQRTFEERVALGIIRSAPMAFWAADRNCKIVFWSQQAEELYRLRESEVLGKDYVDLFVDEAEKPQARLDTATIVDEGLIWKNFLAYDHRRDGTRLTMLTNSFRIWDEQAQEFVQAEVGLEISDLHISQEKHRTLREAGMAMLAVQKRALDLEKKDLAMRTSRAFFDKRRALDERQREANAWIDEIARDVNKAKAEEIGRRKLDEIAASVGELEAEQARLMGIIATIADYEAAICCEVEVEAFEAISDKKC